MPDFKEYVRQNLPALRVPGAREAEIVEELALEFEESYELALRNGLSPEQAWDEVRNNARPWTELGNELGPELYQHRDEEPERQDTNAFSRWLDGVRNDLRFAVRQLYKSPGFTSIAVLTLALGIGANTAIFSLLHAVVLRNLPVHEPNQLVLFGNGRGEGSTNYLPNGNAFSYPFYREFQRRTQVFSGVAAVNSLMFEAHGKTDGGTEFEKINVELVSGTYFETLGVNTVLGRTLTERDDQTVGSHPFAVASYSWWQRRFAGEPSIVGKTLNIGKVVYTIVGVAPPGFFGFSVGRSPDVWIPIMMGNAISPDWNGLEGNRFQTLHIIARQKPEVSLEQAQANTNLVFKRLLLEEAGPQPAEKTLSDIERAKIVLTPAATGRSRLRLEFSSPLKILMAVVALVLIIACANVANLLLARANVRRREIAVRMSVGAVRSRLIRQLLLESGLLALAGSIVGVLVAWGASQSLLMMVSTGSQPLPIRVAPDAAVLGFALAATILTVLLFGTAPAFYATRLDPMPSLKEGRGAAHAPRRNRLARGLVVGQVALSLVLLVGAGLFLRSLAKLMDVNPGFDKENAFVMSVDPGAAGYKLDDRLESMMERVEEGVGSIPGIGGGSFSISVFNTGGWIEDIRIPGRIESDRDRNVNHNIVGPGYFDAMKLPLVLGRRLDSRDNMASRKVAVINETMARMYFSPASPLGRTFSIGDDNDWQNIEVIGVVKDAKYLDLDETQMPAAFYPHAQHSRLFLDNLVVRYTGNPASVLHEIRTAVDEIDPNLPIGDITPLAQLVQDSTLNKRLLAQLCTVFGVLAAFLACLGIYGVMSFGVTRRTNEFGIRMALGAARRQVVWVVLRETLWLAMAGTVIGVLLARASGSLVASLLFGLQPDDALTLGLAIAGIISVALLAGYLPARRATRIDPMEALRHD
jgi:predicted permease